MELPIGKLLWAWIGCADTADRFLLTHRTPPAPRLIPNFVVVWIGRNSRQRRGAFSEPRRAGASRTKCLCMFASLVNSYYVCEARRPAKAGTTKRANNRPPGPGGRGAGARSNVVVRYDARARLAGLATRPRARPLFMCTHVHCVHGACRHASSPVTRAVPL